MCVCAFTALSRKFSFKRRNKMLIERSKKWVFPTARIKNITGLLRAFSATNVPLDFVIL